MGEEVALEFAANVEAAVASVRELATAAQELAAAAKEAADGVAGLAEPATAAGDAIKGVADSATAADGALTTAAGEAKAAAGAYDGLAASAKAAADEQKTAAGAAGEAAAASEGAAAKSGAAAEGGFGKYKMALVGIAGGTALAVDGAVKFQAQTTRLVTSADQSAQGLGQVQQGILQLSAQTGTSTEQLAQGMYTVESAGQHGAAGLEVLKAAAQGARAENASLETVSDAVSSAMADYHLSADQAATVTTKLVAATSAGKTSFEQLAGSMPNILPIASAAHVAFSDILGDLASMTLHGMSAQQASQNLADAIKHMQAPTAVQSKELALLGLNANDLNASLKSNGLSGTINEISDRITHMMPPGSQQVILQMKTALNGLSPEVRSLGTQLMNGSLSMGDYNKAAKDLTGVQAGQASAFATLLKSTHQIGGAQVSGTEVLQNYSSAMYKAMGDATGLKVALMISGENAKTTAGAIGTVSSATVEAGNNVKGWGEITKTTSFQLAKAKDSVEAAGISLGMTLLPAVNAILVPLASFLSMIVGNKAAAIAFAVVIGGVLAGAIGTKAVKAVTEFKSAVETTIGGAEKLVKAITGIGKASDDAAAKAKTSATVQAAASKDTAAAAEKSAAAQEAADEAKWKKSGDLAAKAAATEEGAAADSAAAWEVSAEQEEASWTAAEATAGESAVAEATANEEAAATSSGSWIASSAKAVAAAAVWVAQSVAKVAVVVASNVAGAASTLAAWVATGAGMVAQAAVWVAGTIAKVAIVVGANIAGAVATGAAWVIASGIMLLGIGLVVAAVALAVYEIVTHWRSIVHGVEEAWDAVYHAVSVAVSTVVDFVKTHWMLLLGILLGPIALAVAVFVTYRKQIVSIFEGLWRDVSGFVSRLASDVFGFFERMASDVTGAERRMISDVISDVRKWISDLLSMVLSGLDNIVHFFEGLPARILHGLGNMATLLIGVGRDIVQGLVNGIESMGSFLANAIESLIPSPIRSIVSSVLGIFSPSTVFHGYGQNIVQGLINGVRSMQPQLHGAMTGLTGTVTGAGSAYAASAISPASGGTSVHITAPLTVQAGSGYDTPQFQQYLQAAMQEATLRYDQLNASNGLTSAWGR